MKTSVALRGVINTDFFYIQMKTSTFKGLLFRLLYFGLGTQAFSLENSASFVNHTRIYGIYEFDDNHLHCKVEGECHF